MAPLTSAYGRRVAVYASEYRVAVYRSQGMVPVAPAGIGYDASVPSVSADQGATAAMSTSPMYPLLRSWVYTSASSSAAAFAPLCTFMYQAAEMPPSPPPAFSALRFGSLPTMIPAT